MQDQAQTGLHLRSYPWLAFSPYISSFSCILFQFPLNKPLSHKGSPIRIWTMETNLGYQINPIPRSPWACKVRCFSNPRFKVVPDCLLQIEEVLEIFDNYHFYFFQGKKKADSLRTYSCPKAPKE